MHSKEASGFEVTICAPSRPGEDAEERLGDFERALRAQLEGIAYACGTAVVQLHWSDLQPAHRRFTITFSQPCNGAAVAFAVDASAVATGVAVPGGVVILEPSREHLRLSPEVDRPCEVPGAS